jgi:hypothetical protein
MGALRKTVGKTILDHVSDQDVRQQYGMQPMGEWLLKRREEWDNPKSRMPECSIDIIVREGRPKKRCSDAFYSRNRLSAQRKERKNLTLKSCMPF